VLAHLALSLALVGTDTTTVPACAAPPYRAFDFWVGTWDVRDTSGTVHARSVITRRNGGCTIHEDYTTRTGYTGQSINAYDATRQRWHQTWSDIGGLVLYLDGTSPEAGVMRLEGTRRDQRGEVMDRITWSRLPDGRVRQLWENSRDGGRTWTQSFDGFYERVPAP
jgi:hypothetical protein